MKSVTGKHLLTGVLAFALIPMGCGDDDEATTLECSGDLVEVREQEDGSLHCVARTHGCDDGQVVTPLGQCQSVDIFCGEGTSLDSAGGECVSTSNVECGEGTVADGDRCVLEDPLMCGAGTVLMDGTCVVSEEACGPSAQFDAPYCDIDPDEACDGRSQLDVGTGECVDDGIVECGDETVEVNNQCMPMGSVADDLAADADVEQGDGTPIVADGDEAVIFSGVLEDDVSASFQVEAEAGQWLEVTVMSRGLPSPGFDLNDGGQWSRQALAGMSSQPTRTVLMPESASFELTIGTSETATSGHPDWAYVGTVEVVDAPDAYEWEIFEDRLEGDLRLSQQNWIRADIGDDFDEVMLGIEGVGDDVWDPTVEVWASDDERWSQEELASGTQISVATQGAETLWFHFDAQAFVGPDTDYTVNAQATSILEPGDVQEVEVPAQAGEMIIASHQSDEAVAMDVEVERDGQEVAVLDAVPAEGGSYDVGETPRPFVWAAEAGTYTLRYQNMSDEVASGFVATPFAEETSLFEAADSGRSSFSKSFDDDLYEPGDWQYLVVETVDMTNLEVTVDAGDGAADVAIYDGDRFAVASEEGSDAVTQLNWLSSTAQQVVVAIKPAEAISDGIDIDIDAEVFEGLGPSEVVEETLDLSTNDVFRGQVTPFEGDALDIEVINPNGVVLFEAQEVEEVQEIALIAAGPGEYTLRVSNPGFTPALIGDINVQGITPFEVYDVEGPADESFQRGALSAGDREVMVFRFLSDDMVGVDLDVDEGEATLRVLDPVTQEILGESDDPDELSLGLSGDFGEQRVLEVVADSDLGEGYELSLSELTEFEVDVTSEPGLAIPDNDSNGITDELNVSSCPTILEVAVELDITHTWRGDLIVDVTTPAGEVARLHDRTGGSSDDIQATYPFPDGTGLDDGEELLDFEGTSGTGIWEIFVSDNAFSDTGDLNSWTVTLTCEG